MPPLISIFDAAATLEAGALEGGAAAIGSGCFAGAAAPGAIMLLVLRPLSELDGTSLPPLPQPGNKKSKTAQRHVDVKKQWNGLFILSSLGTCGADLIRAETIDILTPKLY